MNPRQTAEQEAEIQSGPDPLAFDEERPSEEEVDVSAPRTWTLSDRNGEVQVKPHLEPSFTGEGIIHVIEAEPVLDLLERLRNALEMAPFSELGPEPKRDAALQDAHSLLTAHGRLDG